jgi:hypothetical protein
VANLLGCLRIRHFLPTTSISLEEATFICLYNIEDVVNDTGLVTPTRGVFILFGMIAYNQAESSIANVIEADFVSPEEDVLHIDVHDHVGKSKEPRWNLRVFYCSAEK